MRKIFTLVSAVVLALGMQATVLDTIQVDGLYYQINAEDSAATLIRYSTSSKYEIDTIVVPVDVVKDEVSYPVVALGQGAFRNTTAKSITFAEGSKVTTLGMQVFQAAVELTELELPEGVKIIPMSGIHNASAGNPMKMKKLILPSTIDSIVRLSICLPQLDTLVFKGTVPPSINTFTVASSGYVQNPWEVSTGHACNTNKEAVVIVPFGTKEAYQHTPWIGDYFTTIQEDIVEVANIAAFNAVADGQAVKLMLTDAKVTAYNDLFSVFYIEDATAATVVSGAELTVGSALNGYLVGTKSIESVDFTNDPAIYVEHKLIVADDRGMTEAETTIEPTVMTIPEACLQDNYAKLITIENVTISGGGKNKTLTDANENTIKSRDLLGVLSTEYEWPTKVSSFTGILLYYMTGWFIVPISEEAIVINTEGVENLQQDKKETVKFILNGHLYIQHRDRIYDAVGR